MMLLLHKGKGFFLCSIFALVLPLLCFNHFKIKKETMMMQSEVSAETNLKQILVESLSQGEAGVVLQPPYRIAIFGETRTGSTFMHQLLYAIVRIKVPPEENVSMLMNKVTRGNFVTKCHVAEENPQLLGQVERDQVSVFISTRDRDHLKFNSAIASRALYMQETVNLQACSLCEVDAYIGIFNLTNAEIQQVKDYMATYEIIRQCCGLQMSRWERMRLHGCSITDEDRARPDYVQCDNVNKTEVEMKMASNPGGIKYAGMHPKFNWMKVGDCERFDRQVIRGGDFNGMKFKTSVEACNALKGKGKFIVNVKSDD